MIKPVLTKAFLQPAKAAAMCTALCAETCPPPPIPPFLLAQNLSSKRIAPTDNMRSKLHDEYTHYQWLKHSKFSCHNYRTTARPTKNPLTQLILWQLVNMMFPGLHCIAEPSQFISWKCCRGILTTIVPPSNLMTDTHNYTSLHNYKHIHNQSQAVQEKKG